MLMSSKDAGSSGSEPQIFTAGTLKYTKAGLFVLFAWLLWGDFCFTLMEKVRPATYPLYLLGPKQSKASTSQPAASQAAYLTPAGSSAAAGTAAVSQPAMQAAAPLSPASQPAALATSPSAATASQAASGVVRGGINLHPKPGEPRIEPLRINNQTYNWLILTLPQIFGILVGPAVSFKSDRHRGKWGRRIPFIVVTAPFLVIFLLGLGLAPYFANFWSGAGAGFAASLGLTPMTMTVVTIGVCLAGFSFMDEFVNSVFWYLFADVVPQSHLGRFMGMFRTVGIGIDLIWQFFITQYSLRYLDIIFLSIGVLYFVGFTLMCWRVREGEYPPPEDLGEKPGIFKQIKTYVVECFIHPIYVLWFASEMLSRIGNTANGGNAVFMQSLMGKGSLDENLKLMGFIGGWLTFLPFLLSYSSGWIVDKFHPMRIAVLAAVLNLPLIFARFFFLHGIPSHITFAVLSSLVALLSGAAGSVLGMTIFPKDKYGQFASCAGMCRSFGIILFAPVAGIFMDWMTDKGNIIDNYRYMFLWQGTCLTLSLGCLFLVLGLWKKYGGEKGYLAPGSAAWKAREQEAQREPTAAV
jgi:maltose/moltooligosaccharide transporter